jgi:nucleoside-diphosphate-sugar epimerase
VKRSEDPRDYKVSFERIRSELGFEPKERVPDGIREIMAALAAREFGDPYAAHFGN